MFGMLDYRAHKLFWLLMLPIRILARILFFVALGGSILVAQWTEFPTVAKIVVGYAAFEAALILVVGLFSLLVWPIRSVFFWLIDVVPAKGDNEEEARAIVTRGPFIWLEKKLATDIENWSSADTRAFISLLNWRAKLICNAGARVKKRVARFKQFYRDTGRQPGSLTEKEMKELLNDFRDPWFHTAIMHQNYFNMIVGSIIITFAILLLNAPPR